MAKGKGGIGANAGQRRNPANLAAGIFSYFSRNTI